MDATVEYPLIQLLLSCSIGWKGPCVSLNAMQERSEIKMGSVIVPALLALRENLK
jgi:hypothetical protein